MREADTYNHLVKSLIASGFLAYRIRDDAGGKKPFDLVGCSPSGRYVGLEVKIADSLAEGIRKLSPHQLNWLMAVAKRNGFAILATLDSVKRWHIGLLDVDGTIRVDFGEQVYDYDKINWKELEFYG